MKPASRRAPPRPVLYLHIGAHKTATTSLQRALHTHRDALAGHGVLYPDTNRFHFAQHRLAFALKGTRDPKTKLVPDLATEIAELRAEIEARGLSRIVVSSEAFFVMREARLKQLRSALSEFDIRIIAVVRRPDDYLLSMYNQNAKGVGNGFVRSLSQVAADPRKLGREISFAHWVGLWSKVFGSEAVTLWRFEDGMPLERLLNLLDLPPGLITQVPHGNRSAPRLAVEAVRLAKRLRLPAGVQIVVQRLASRVFARTRLADLDLDQRQHILDVFADENDAMFAGFGMENTYRSLKARVAAQS